MITAHKGDHGPCPARPVCEACAVRFSWLTLVVNGALALLKTVIGLMAASRALIASALYSVNDVISAVIVMISMRVARQPPDEDHAYGHGKAEFVAIGVLSTILAAAVVFILIYSVVDILRGVDTPPHLIALPVAAVTMATNEFLARRGFCAARRAESPVLQTSAEHNRADAISSAAAMLGITGATLGLHWMDPGVAIFETVHIVYLSGSLLGHALRGLMDSSLPPGEVEAIARACRAVPRVQGVLALRTRHAGPHAWVDVALRVDGGLRVEQTAELRRQVKREIRAALPHSMTIQVKFVVSAEAAPARDSGNGAPAASSSALQGAGHG